MAVIAGVSGVFFWLLVRDLDKQEDALNDLREGKFGEQKTNESRTNSYHVDTI
jgi:POT family proton-dependent oligopeptide transporter